MSSVSLCFASGSGDISPFPEREKKKKKGNASLCISFSLQSLILCILYLLAAYILRVRMPVATNSAKRRVLTAAKLYRLK